MTMKTLDSIRKDLSQARRRKIQARTDELMAEEKRSPMSNELKWTKRKVLYGREEVNEYISDRYCISPLSDGRWYLMGRDSTHLWNAYGTLKSAKQAAQKEYDAIHTMEGR